MLDVPRNKGNEMKCSICDGEIGYMEDVLCSSCHNGVVHAAADGILESVKRVEELEQAMQAFVEEAGDFQLIGAIYWKSVFIKLLEKP